MKNRLILILGLLIAAILVFYMFAFQVRYDEVAIRTTFGKAVEPTVSDAGVLEDRGSVYVEPALYFRLPPPIHQVHRYSTQIQILDDVIEEQQTADAFSVIVRVYAAWRVSDPLAFHRSLGSMDRAADQLKALLQANRGIIGAYRFDELVNVDAQRIKLREMEEKMAARLQEAVDQIGYGIAIEQVGVRRLVLPEKVTEKVFERMKSVRQALAANAEEMGKGRAQGIRSEAESVKERILAFARGRAEQIRAEGIAEAAQYYRVFGQTPEAEQFAIFLQKLEAMKQAFKHRTTFVLGSDFAGLEYFKNPPDVQPKAVEQQVTGR